MQRTLLAVALFGLKCAIGCAGSATSSAPAEPAAAPAPPPRSAPANADPASTEAASGGPDGPGELPMSVVEEHMVDVRAAVTRCAEQTTYEGKVTVRITISPGGSAAAVLQPGSGDAAIDDCMTGAFTRALFPSSERGQTFQYSYRF